MKNTDGTGAPILDDDLYYVQDARTAVGNCGSWWAPKGDGYVCDIEKAGLYRGSEVRKMRDTDVPWPHKYVTERVVVHVRVDTPDFRRRDDAYKSVDGQRIVELAKRVLELRHSSDDPLQEAIDELREAIEQHETESKR